MSRNKARGRAPGHPLPPAAGWIVVVVIVVAGVLTGLGVPNAAMGGALCVAALVAVHLVERIAAVFTPRRY